MTLGLHDMRPRRRNKVRWAIFKFLAVVGVLFVLGLFAYNGGSMLARQEVFKLEKQVVELDGTVAALREETADLSAKLQAAETRANEWQQRYEREVPTGDSKALFDLVQERLAAGVEVSRLDFLIGGAENRKTCDGEITTKRFLAKTPLYSGANDSVSFARNRITITAEGQSAINAAGNREGWFDPAKPITIRFTEVGGKTSEKTGALPVYHSIVIGDSEFRFAALAGDKGFVKVTGARCPYP